MPELLSNEAKLYYDVRVKVFPLFLPMVFLESPAVEKTSRIFKDKFKVITWDVRGHGYSTLPDGPS